MILRDPAVRQISAARTYLVSLDRRIGAEWAVVLLILCIVIQARWVHSTSPNLAQALGLLTVCGFLAAVLIAPASPAISLQSVPAKSLAGPRWISLAAGVVGILCAIVATRLVAGDEWNAQWWWVAGMMIPVLALVVTRVMAWLRGDRAASVSRLDLAIMGLLLGVALATRVPDITGSPPFVFGDEASCGLYGRLFDTGHVPLLSISWFGLPMLSYAVSGVGLRLFGDTLSGLRLIDALIGAFAVVLLYRLGTEWFGRRAGGIGALILAVSFLHIEVSRNGLHYIQGPTCITLTLYLFTLVLKRGGILTALLAGMSVILDLQVYWSARIAPLLIVGVLGFLLFFQRALLFERRRELIWMLAGTLIAGLPVIELFHSVPGSFNGHQGSVNIFSSDPNTVGHLISQYGHIGRLQLIQEQAWRVLSTFNARGDASELFGPWGGSLLDGVTASLLPAAFFLMVFRSRHWQYLLCLAWFSAVVVAGILTIDPPIWPRLSALTPAVALMVGVLLADLWSIFERRDVHTLAIAGTLAVLLGAIALENVHEVFVDYPTAMRQTSVGPTDVGNFLARAPGASSTVLLSDGSFFVDYETIRFLAPSASGCTLMTGEPLSACPLAQSSKVFVLLPGRQGDLPSLERQRPGGHVVTVGTFSNGSARITAYELK